MGTTTIPPPAADDKRDYRDLAISDLADEGAQLRYELAIVSADRDAYRALAKLAIHQLSDAHRQQLKHSDDLARERDQARWLRVHILTKAT